MALQCLQLSHLSKNKAAACFCCAIGLQWNVTVTMATSAQYKFWGQRNSEALAFHIHSSVSYKWEQEWDARTSDCLQVFVENWRTRTLSMWRQSKAWRRSEKSAYQIPFVNLTLCLIFKKPPDHSDAHASCLCCRGYRARGESQRQHSQHYNRTPAGTMSHSNVSSGVGVKSGNCKRRK